MALEGRAAAGMHRTIPALPVRSIEAARNVLDPISADGVTLTDFGTREFANLDLDGNLIEFVQWMTAESQERTT